MGMRVGMPNAGQINALETLNIRGERSVTCKGAFDAHPSTGPLPAGAPPTCEAFRQQPDALERAAELDAQYGTQSGPGRAADVLRRRGVQGSVRHEGHAHDVQQRRQLRDGRAAVRLDARRAAARQGRHHLCEVVAHEFNGGPGDPGGAAKAKTQLGRTAGSRSARWSGQACNPYDTERVSRGSSGGSGVAVGGNLATIGICEQSGASCQGPASRNGIALILTTKGIMPDSGGIGNQWFNDRAGIHARTLDGRARACSMRSRIP